MINLRLSVEEAVCNVNGDALFALGLKAIDEQRKVNFFTRIAHLATVSANGFQLVFIDHFGVVQQSANQRTFPVVYAATGQQAE